MYSKFLQTEWLDVGTANINLIKHHIIEILVNRRWILNNTLNYNPWIRKSFTEK